MSGSYKEKCTACLFMRLSPFVPVVFAVFYIALSCSSPHQQPIGAPEAHLAKSLADTSDTSDIIPPEDWDPGPTDELLACLESWRSEKVTRSTGSRVIEIQSNSSWKATTSVDVDPGCPANPKLIPLWTTANYDDSHWRNAHSPYVYWPHYGIDHALKTEIMWDCPNGCNPPGTGPMLAFFRYTFTLEEKVINAFASLSVDDNFQFYINGNLVYDDHGYGASVEGPMDITPYLRQGLNAFAVKAWDGGGCRIYNRLSEGVAFLAFIETEEQVCYADTRDATRLAQGAAPWAADHLGTSTPGYRLENRGQAQYIVPTCKDHPQYTVGSKGCLLVTCTMALNSVFGFNYASPSYTNQVLKDACMYLPGGELVVSEATEFLLEYEGLMAPQHNKRFVPPSRTDLNSKEALEEIVCSSRFPVHVRVKIGADGRSGHSVLVVGMKGDKFSIWDSASRVRSPSGNIISEPGIYLEDYKDAGWYYVRGEDTVYFEIRGYVKDPNDFSSFSISSKDKANLLLITSAGDKTGWESATGTIHREIPNSAYCLDLPHICDETGDPLPHSPEQDTITPLQSIYISTPPQGDAMLYVAAHEPAAFTVRVISRTALGVGREHMYLAGMAGPNHTVTYTFDIDNSAAVLPKPVRKATIGTTLADVDNAVALGLIDNQGIANALKSKLNAAAQSIEHGNIHAATNALKAFRSQVYAQADKHITMHAAYSLLDAVNNIIEKPGP